MASQKRPLSARFLACFSPDAHERAATRYKAVTGEEAPERSALSFLPGWDVVSGAVRASSAASASGLRTAVSIASLGFLEFHKGKPNHPTVEAGPSDARNAPVQTSGENYRKLFFALEEIYDKTGVDWRYYAVGMLQNKEAHFEKWGHNLKLKHCYLIGVKPDKDGYVRCAMPAPLAQAALECNVELPAKITLNCFLQIAAGLVPEEGTDLENSHICGHAPCHRHCKWEKKADNQARGAKGHPRGMPADGRPKCTHVPLCMDCKDATNDEDAWVDLSLEILREDMAYISGWLSGGKTSKGVTRHRELLGRAGFTSLPKQKLVGKTSGLLMWDTTRKNEQRVPPGVPLAKWLRGWDAARFQAAQARCVRQRPRQPPPEGEASTSAAAAAPAAPLYAYEPVPDE